MTETIIIGSTATIDLETPKMKAPYFIESEPDEFQNIISGCGSTEGKMEEAFSGLFSDPVLTTISGGEIPVIVKELCHTHYPENVIEPVTKERLHKQPRGYLKTVASLVGRDKKNNMMLRNSPGEMIEETYERETIPKQTAITGNFLLQLWPEREE